MGKESWSWSGGARCGHGLGGKGVTGGMGRARPLVWPLTQAAAGAGAHAGQDDHVQLPALEGVHGLDEDLGGGVVVVGGVWG